MTMPQLHVLDRDGRRHVLDTVEGWRVMEIIRDHGLLEGQCGGACACGTCHVVVAPEWADRLHPARDEEIERLDELPIIENTSRLACQIIWSDDLDGLSLALAEAA
jgi:2Fe-2S ferredoxin